MKSIHILIPTYKRLKALAVTLTSLCYQKENDFDIIVSDQSPDDEIYKDNSVQTAIRLLELRGVKTSILKNLPPRGMAQQRQFLLDQSAAPYVLFLDDDLILEPYVVQVMKETIEREGCGFVGSAVIGLSYLNVVRPHEQHIELWDKVQPEDVLPGTSEWQRYKLHNAANVYHVQQNLKADPSTPISYKVAWVGGCVMYDAQKLADVGGFNFWEKLPERHCGEDVLAQLRVMKKHGGCGILPTGVYHQELETTVPDRTINAPEVLAI
ncbi:glycosyltransferase family 2 protein [Chryseosolibacter indicus]|uniref:Glycosyltransferase n=1 Tax=Chryseosolibacter indicus TaxID=2782351 RepID=A0ABS5VPB3_9BACT|nr:glycosyltransferase family 2 protein [Chryseosolibacter indicus]MBT1702863.1 glycosyltransferase [Chryseosolibacter indicus]